MKRLIIISIMLMAFSFVTQAQETSLLHPRQQQYSTANQEDFKVTFTISNYGITFKRNDSVLDDSMKVRIRKFIKKNSFTYPEYQANGSLTLHIIKRQGQYYVVYRESPEKLLKL